MAFEIYIVDHAPMTDVDDTELVALQFMEDIGYIMKHYDPKTPTESVKMSVPYKLFLDCLLRHQDKDWRVDELSVKLFESTAGEETTLDFEALPASMPVEQRLSRLTRWVLDADAAALRYSLRLPHVQIGADSGPQQRLRCLEALALYPVPAGAGA